MDMFQWKQSIIFTTKMQLFLAASNLIITINQTEDINISEFLFNYDPEQLHSQVPAVEAIIIY